MNISQSSTPEGSANRAATTRAASNLTAEPVSARIKSGPMLPSGSRLEAPGMPAISATGQATSLAVSDCRARTSVAWQDLQPGSVCHRPSIAVAGSLAEGPTPARFRPLHGAEHRCRVRRSCQ